MTDQERTLVNAMNDTFSMIDSVKEQLKKITDNIDSAATEDHKRMILKGTMYLQKAQSDLWNALGQFTTPSQTLINIEPNTEEDLKRIYQELGRPIQKAAAV